MKLNVLRFVIAPIVLATTVMGSAAADAAGLDAGGADRLVSNPAVRVPGFALEPSATQSFSISPTAARVHSETIVLAQPSITIDVEQGAFEALGQNFTPGGKVELQVLADFGVDPVLITEELTAASTPTCHTSRQCAGAAAPGTVRFVTTADFLQNLPCDTRVDAIALDQTTQTSDRASLYWCPGVMS